jgi:crotonobetainyl-CoA:carnitine CoA-transferase CaiB-like acyl-CoA transferase
LLPEGAPPEQQVSESWIQYSRNKLSLGLDLRREEGQAVFLDLVRHSDIWVESSRPGTFEKLGLSDERAFEANRRLTIVHVSGFGRSGIPERVRAPSFDLIGQAYSGYLSLQGNPDPDPPVRAGTALNDTVTGLAAATAALMGYVNAQRTGIGQSIDVAQYEIFFMLLENLALDYFVRGVKRTRQGTAHARLHPYDLFRAANGWVVVAAPTQESWLRLKPLLHQPDPDWDDPEKRRAHRTEVDGRIAQLCAQHSVRELEELGVRSDVAISRVYSIDDIARDPHYRSRGMFVEWEDPTAGRVKGAGIAPKFARTPAAVWRGAPWLGQDNELILLRKLGYSLERVIELRAMGVLGKDPPMATPDLPTPFFAREGL